MTPSDPHLPDSAAPFPISRRSWLAASGALVAGACAGGPGGAGSPRAAGTRTLDEVAAELPRLMRLASVPGVSLAVVGRGGTEARGFGVRRAGGEDAVTGDTVFEAASLGKPVFAYLVLRLAELGRLEMDRPLREYLPLPNPSDARAAGITAGHVLSHSGGWPNWRFARESVLTADFEPGSRFSYSGEGFYFLQRVVEHVTGRGVAAVAREMVLEPLGMRASAFVWNPALGAALAAPHNGRGVPQESFGAGMGSAFHRLAQEAGQRLEEWRHEDAERALARVRPEMPALPNFLLPNVAGSFLTTARDYAAFVAHLLGVGAPAGGRAILERMMAPRVTANEAVRWGLGWGLEDAEGATRFWHWGDTNGFKNYVVGDPAAGTAIVVFTNGNSGARVYERVVRALDGIDHPAFLMI
jgi:CubicO group peptidase (beta-lactamase class C family)